MQNTTEKIIIIGPGYPYRSGQSIYLSSLCLQLSQSFKVKLINFSLLYPKFLFPGTTQYDESKDRKIKFPNKRLINSINPISWWKTARYINSENPDLIAIDWWHPFFGICKRGIIFFLNKKMKGRVIFITENVISHEANKTDKMLTKIGLSKSKGFLALSNAVEKELKLLFDKPIFTSTLPIYDFYNSSSKDLDFKKRFHFNDDDIVFLFFGLVRQYKGLDLLIEAFAKVRSNHNNIKLLIAGEFYDNPAEYFSLIKKYEIEKDVRLENKYIAEEDVSKYFHAADCVVLPYRSATQSGILSMAYGFNKPVLATNVGELAQLISHEKTGLIIPAPSYEEIALSLEKFLELKNLNTDFNTNIARYLDDIDEFKNVNIVFSKILSFLKSH